MLAFRARWLEFERLNPSVPIHLHEMKEAKHQRLPVRTEPGSVLGIDRIDSTGFQAGGPKPVRAGGLGGQGAAEACE